MWARTASYISIWNAAGAKHIKKQLVY